MKSIPRAGIYLDTRYESKDKLYPVKIRVTYTRKTRFYKTAYRLSENQFKRSYSARSPQGRMHKLKDDLLKLENRAKRIIQEMTEFSFTQFENLYYQQPNDQDNIYQVMDFLISEYRENNQLTSAEHYSLAKAKLQSFFGPRQNQVSFKEITSANLRKLQKHILETGCNLGTVGIYQRCIRRTFNYAIRKNIISQEFYPFKSRNPDGYQIPEPINKKRPLSNEQIRTLLAYNPVTDTATERGYDIWLLSFFCYGMNLHDLLFLRIHDFTGDKISFRRAKGRNAKKPSMIEVPLRPRARHIIEKYSTNSQNPDDFLFPFLKMCKTEEDLRKGKKNFTRSVSAAMKRIARDLALPQGISTIWSRHSYASTAKNQGVPKEFISETLGHSSLSTTDSYLGSFSDEVLERQTDKIYGDFDGN